MIRSQVLRSVHWSALTLTALAFATTAASAPAPQGFDVDAAVALRAYQGMVEEHLAGVLRSLKALAVTPEAQSGRWDAVRPALERLGGDLPTAATAWFAQPDGSYVSTEKGPAAQTLKDRAYFPDLLAGRDVVGSLVVSKSTGQRSIIIATPVMKAGEMMAALGVSVRATEISDLVTRRTAIPANLTFYALDARGQTAIHRDPKLMFEYPSDLGDESLKSAVKEMFARPEGVVRYRWADVPRTAIFSESQLLGWRFVLVRVGQ